MANTLLLKRSSISGKAPASSDLQQGELALNSADGRLFCKKTDGSIFVINPQFGIAPQVFSVQFTVPLNAYTFVTSFPSAQMGQNVFCCLSGTTANGAFADEYEMEPMSVYGMIYANGAIAFTVTCASPFLVTMGTKNILYYVG